MGVKASCGPWEGCQSLFISQFTKANIPFMDAGEPSSGTYQH
jgi:hypothetical protein